MHLKRLITVLLIIHAFGCIPKHPGWVTNGRHPGYSSDQFLIGIGLSSRSRDIQADVQKADANARLEVAKQLRVKIQSHLTSRQEQKSSALLPQTYTSKTVVGVEEEVDLLLEGITIVDRYYSKKEQLHYSIAALNKSETAKRLTHEITRHRDNVKALSRQSDQLLKQGEIIGALHKKIRAMDHYRNYISKKQRVAVLTPHALESPEASPIDPYDGIVALKNSIALIRLDGDMQAGRISTPLARPLSVKAVYRQKTPINNLPVSVQFQGDTGRAEQNRVTGNDGKAEIKILDIGKPGNHLNPMAVSVDWDRIVKEALRKPPSASWAGFLAGPSVHFKYSLRLPNVSNVLIKICNGSGYPNVDAAAILHSVSVGHLKREGFLIKKSGRGQTACSSTMGMKSLVRKYKRITDILIIEKVDVDFAGRRGRGYVFRARMSVTAYDMAYDMAYHEVIASLEKEALGGANSKKNAAERAIKEVANELIPQIASRIAESL